MVAWGNNAAAKLDPSSSTWNRTYIHGIVLEIIPSVLFTSGKARSHQRLFGIITIETGGKSLRSNNAAITQ